MAANISQLTDDYLFRARNEKAATDYAAQKDWLYALYQAAAGNSDSEVTTTTFKGISTQIQYRGATPEDHRLALKAAVEQLEAKIAGAIAANFSRPFGFRWSPAPAVALDNAYNRGHTISP